MERIALGAALSAMLLAATPAQAQAPAPAAQAPSWPMPADSARCPSKWGAADERGAGNLMKPHLVLDAVKLIKTGEESDLAPGLGAGMPFFGTRGSHVH